MICGHSLYGLEMSKHFLSMQANAIRSLRIRLAERLNCSSFPSTSTAAVDRHYREPGLFPARIGVEPCPGVGWHPCYILAGYRRLLLVGLDKIGFAATARKNNEQLNLDF